jgi:hypothetical protein
MDREIQPKPTPLLHLYDKNSPNFCLYKTSSGTTGVFARDVGDVT